MTAPVFPDQIVFTVFPSEGGSEIPAATLSQNLTALQEMVYLAALHAEGRTLRERLRLPEEIKNRYILQCAPPVMGSFSVRGRVVDRGPVTDLLTPVQSAAVAALVLGFCCAVSLGDATKASAIIPDSSLRNRMIACIGKLSPTLGSGHRCVVSGSEGEASLDDSGLRDEIKALLTPPATREQMQTVTGTLNEIDFAEHKLTIFHMPTQRELECFYDESIEAQLLESRRGLIQVTGIVVLDGNNQPRKIIDVEQIWGLDLSPLVVAETEGRQFSLKANHRTELVPTLSPDQQLVCLEHNPWGLDVFAETRMDLLLEFKNQLLMLWAEYAKEDDAVLSEPARKVKQQLRDDWTEVARA